MNAPANTKAEPRLIPSWLSAFQLTRSNWYRWSLLAITALSLFLNCFQLGQRGFSNPYYAAGVRSMLMSWYNFFFVSFDSAGFVSIDKPPLGFWIQTAFALLLGFYPLSVMLPQ